VDENNNIILGEGRREIFENIEKTGSLNQTAKIMKMSYKAVWGKVKATEEHLKIKMITTNKKRGSVLTKEGKELLQKYIELQEQCMKMDDHIFNSLFRGN
jgi:molybdate transport system regulatory protein